MTYCISHVLVITLLTTVALGSVEGEHSGLASGVNNTVARVARLWRWPF